MKRNFYIFCFMVLGLILQQIAHSILEMGYIWLMRSDFETFSFGLSWNSWLVIHGVFSILLLISGISWGYYSGVNCWQWIYVEGKRSAGFFKFTK